MSSAAESWANINVDDVISKSSSSLASLRTGFRDDIHESNLAWVDSKKRGDIGSEVSVVIEFILGDFGHDTKLEDQCGNDFEVVSASSRENHVEKLVVTIVVVGSSMTVDRISEAREERWVGFGPGDRISHDDSVGS